MKTLDEKIDVVTVDQFGVAKVYGHQDGTGFRPLQYTKGGFTSIGAARLWAAEFEDKQRESVKVGRR